MKYLSCRRGDLPPARRAWRWSRAWKPGALVLALWAGALAVSAQPASTTTGTRIYRCGNTYTNDLAEAQAKGCRLIDGGHVTVVQGTRVQSPPPRPAGGAGPQAVASAGSGTGTAGGPRADGAEQRARDADARFILETELKKAEARHAELLKEYNNGEPERLGAEARNYQKYLDRVADLKAAVARSEADMAGIRRELSRLAASK